MGLWFLPTCMIVAATALGIVLTALDPVIDEWITALYPPFFGISAEGARAILTAVATAMLSVAGVVFSITMVTLSLAANQYTSRILRTFTRDRGTQLVLGVLLSVFAYCLVVLRGIRAPTEQDPGFVPSLAVLLGIIFALAGILFLVYFIQHISSMIQASEIVARIAEDTMEVVRREVQEQADRGEGATQSAKSDDGDAGHIESIAAPGTGYVRRIEWERLTEIAAAHDVVVHVPVLLGAFVTPRDVLFNVRSEPDSPDQSFFKSLESVVGLGPSGDIYEDPRFGVRQLVDVAVKALSPGINDPTTAVTCIDRLGVVLVEAMPLRGGEQALSKDGEPRVIVHRVGFTELLDGSFDQLIVYAQGQHGILLRVLSALGRLADSACEQRHRTAVHRQVERVLEVSGAGATLAGDRSQLQARANELLERLEDRG